MREYFFIFFSFFFFSIHSSMPRLSKTKDIYTYATNVSRVVDGGERVVDAVLYSLITNQSSTQPQET